MKKGIDAPIVPILFIVFGILGLILSYMSGDNFNYIFSISMFFWAGLYLNASLRGKYRIINQTVNSLAIAPNSKVLDIGTGHGAVLLEVAKHLKSPGKVTGIDIWQAADQSQNTQAATQQNIDLADVNAVTALKTADMTKLPFPDASFDYVMASLSIHNVKPQAKRQQALAEAMRVLKNHGKLVIIDIEHVKEYRKYLEKCGYQNIQIKNTGINGLYGCLPTKVLICEKQPK